MMQDRLQELFPVHYRNGNILMINANCMDVMIHIQNNEVELSCVDPPYRDENQPTKEMRNKINGKMKEFGKKPDQKYFNELFVTCRQISSFILVNNLHTHHTVMYACLGGKITV